jgi:hypothetical protein
MDESVVDGDDELTVYSTIMSSSPVSGDVCFRAAAKLASTSDMERKADTLLKPEPACQSRAGRVPTAGAPKMKADVTQAYQVKFGTRTAGLLRCGRRLAVEAREGGSPTRRAELGKHQRIFSNL